MSKISLGLLILFTASFLFKLDGSYDQDLGRHIKSGELIFKTDQVPTTNLFSYTYPEFPFVDHHWLFQLLVYLSQNYVGAGALLFIKITVLLISVWLVLSLIAAHSSLITLSMSFIYLHILRERTELRPEIFSFLFTALTYWILERFVRQPSRLRHKSLWLLPLIQLVWVNTHIYFPLGLMVQGIFLADSVWRRSWKLASSLSMILVISTLVCLVNPNLAGGALYPFKVFGNYGYTIVENQTIFLLDQIGFKDPNIFFVKASWIIAVLSILVLVTRRRVDIKSLGLIGMGMGLSLTNIRSTPYLIFISLPSAANTLNLLFQSGIVKLIPIRDWNPVRMIAYLIIGVIVLGESFGYLSGDYYKLTDSRYSSELSFSEHGRGALDFVLKHDLPGPIFNNFDIGSYITYRAYPKLKVFVDGRPEAYPASFFQETYIPAQYDYEKFKKLDEEFKFNSVIFSHTDQTPWGKAFIKGISSDKEWNLVFFDDFMVVYIKEKILQEKQLQVIDLDRIDPKDYNYSNHVSYLSMALYLFNTPHSQKGVEFTQKALQVFSNSPAANSIMARAYSQSPNFADQVQVGDFVKRSANFIWW